MFSGNWCSMSTKERTDWEKTITEIVQTNKEFLIHIASERRP